MQVQFITSVAVIAPDPPVSRKLYVDTLGLPLERLDEDYFASGHVAGSKHFGVWPLSQAAQACYGTPDWPHEVPVPQASIEFEVANPDAVADAARELQKQGYAHPAPSPGAKRSPASCPPKASSSDCPSPRRCTTNPVPQPDRYDRHSPARARRQPPMALAPPSWDRCPPSPRNHWGRNLAQAEPPRWRPRG